MYVRIFVRNYQDRCEYGNLCQNKPLRVFIFVGMFLFQLGSHEVTQFAGVVKTRDPKLGSRLFVAEEKDPLESCELNRHARLEFSSPVYRVGVV